MPNQAPGICPECRRVADAGKYCQAHARDNRETRAAREREAARRRLGLKALYDSRQWRSLTRPFILARDPLCRIAALCGGRAASEDVDHIVPAEIYIAQNGGDAAFFFDAGNLRGACHADHAHKTALEQRGRWREAEMRPASAEGDGPTNREGESGG